MKKSIIKIVCFVNVIILLNLFVAIGFIYLLNNYMPVEMAKLNKNINYENVSQNQLENKILYEDKYNKGIEFLIYYVSVSITCVFVFKCKNRGCLKKIKHVKDIDDLIEPVLAESLIDEKVDYKNLIMSAILIMIKKGSIKIDENSNLIYVNYDNLSRFEYKIANIIFKSAENNKISFEEINNIFWNNNKTSRRMYKEFIELKEDIVRFFYAKKLYSKACDSIMLVIKKLSFWVILFSMIVSIYYLDMILRGNYNFIYVMFFAGIIVAFIILNLIQLITRIEGRFKIHNDKVYKNNLEKVEMIILIIYMILISVYNIKIGLIVFGLIILNKLSEGHIYTEKGKEELRKLLGLKKYISEYSFLNEKEINDVIIWDEYLSYAVAFGMPNKILKLYKDKVLEANIFVQSMADTLEKYIKVMLKL